MIRSHETGPLETGVFRVIIQSKALIDGRKAEAGDPSRVPAHALEQRVITALKHWLANHASSNPLKAAQLHQLGLLDPDRTDATLIGQLLHRVTIHREAITLLVREPGPSSQATSAMADQRVEGADASRALPGDGSHLIRAASGYQRIDPQTHGPDQTDGANKQHPASDRQATLERQNRERLAGAIARAFRWKAELRQGINMETIAAREARSARNILKMLTSVGLPPILATDDFFYFD